MSTAGVLAGKGYVQIGLNDSPLMSGIRAMQAKMKAAGEAIRSAGAGMFSVGATGIAAFVPAVLMASDAAEGFNRFQAVMGEEASRADEKLGEMAKRIGRVKSELRDTSSSFQGLLVGLGMTKAEAADTAIKLTELSLDFASFNNLADADASERFLAGLSGSGEVFDRFGINIKDAQLKIKLAEMGIKGTATELQKAQARIAIIQDSMARQGATRDATTTANSFSNQLKAIGAEAKQAAQDVGNTLLPEILKYTPAVRQLIVENAQWLKQNPELILQAGKLAVGLTAGGVALMAIGHSLIFASNAIGAATTATKFMIANWQAFLVLGVAAAIGALAYEYIYKANPAILEHNWALEKSVFLNRQLAESQQKRFDKTPTTNAAETEAALKLAEKDAAGLANQVQGARKQVDGLATTWNTLSGNKILEAERHALKQLEERAASASERVQQLREKLREQQQAEKAAADAKAEKAHQKETAKTRGFITSLFPDEIASNLVDAGKKKANELAWNARKMAAQIQQQQQPVNYKAITESITGTFSGAALGRQGATASLAKKQEEAATKTAANTKLIADKIDALAKALTFG